MSFIPLFCFNLTVLVHSYHSRIVVFGQAAVLGEKTLKAHRTLPAQHQTAHRHSERTVNIVHYRVTSITVGEYNSEHKQNWGFWLKKSNYKHCYVHVMCVSWKCVQK